MNNQENIGKTIVTSAGNINTSSIFRNETRPGAVMKKTEDMTRELGLDQIIKSCPRNFLPVLAERLEDVRFKFNANERELVMVADALVENLKAYIDKEVKKPMTPEEAIVQVRLLLSQQKSDTTH